MIHFIPQQTRLISTLNNISPIIVVMWHKIIYFIIIMNGKLESYASISNKARKIMRLQVSQYPSAIYNKNPIYTEL